MRMRSFPVGAGYLVVFAIDAGTGQLHPTGEEVEVPKPVCVKFMAPAR